MNNSPDENNDVEGDQRSYHPQPTPRTYIAGSWRDPDKRREVIDYIASEYDWYIDRMVPAKLRSKGWKSDIDAEICSGEVKKRFLMPSDAVLSGEESGFWLERWDRNKGPLRSFFLTCIRNFISDWCDKNKHRKEQLSLADTTDDIGPASSEPHPAELAEQREFEARYDKRLFIQTTMDAYGHECGRESTRWRAYAIYTSSWPQPTMREVAEQLSVSPDEVNNAIHRGRLRVQELLWWGIRALEMDDVSADRAMLELVGRLPACRDRKILPNPPARNANQTSSKKDV